MSFPESGRFSTVNTKTGEEEEVKPRAVSSTALVTKRDLRLQMKLLEEQMAAMESPRAPPTPVARGLPLKRARANNPNSEEEEQDEEEENNGASLLNSGDCCPTLVLSDHLKQKTVFARFGIKMTRVESGRSAWSAPGHGVRGNEGGRDRGNDGGRDIVSDDASHDSIESFSSDEHHSGGSPKGSSKGSFNKRGTVHVRSFEDSEDSDDSDDDRLFSGKGRATSGKSGASGKRGRVSGNRRDGTSGKATYQTLTTGNTPTPSGKPKKTGKSKKTGKPKKSGKPKPDPRTWEDKCTDEWLWNGKTAETRRKYRGHVDNLYQFLMEHCDIQPNKWYIQVTYTNLLAWRKHIIETASKSTKQPRVAAVKSLFGALATHRRIKENPALYLKVPSKPPPSTVVRYLTKEEVQTALDATKNQKDRGLIAGCYYGMLRLKEVRTLKYESCTFVEKDGTELLQLHVIGKGQDEKERDVLVGKTGTAMLKPVILATKEGQYLFPGNDGPLSSRQTGRRIKNVCKRAGLPRSSAHWFRHAGASHAYDNGATLVELRDMLGHSDIKVTSHYLHSDPGTAAARALDRDEEEEEEEEEDSVPKMTPKETSQQLKMEFIQMYKDGLITKEDMMEMMKST